MRTYTAEHGKMIVLGKRGETMVQLIKFDVSDWPSRYGEDGRFVLLAQREGDEAPYPITYSLEDGIITWPITNIDTAKAGFGWCEVQYYIGDSIAKSLMWKTRVIEAIGEPSEEPPDPYITWTDSVLSAANSIISAQEAVMLSASQAALDADSAATSAQAAAKTLDDIRAALDEVSDSDGTLVPMTETIFLDVVQEVL